MHPTEIGEGAILPIIPKAASIDQEKDRRLARFAKFWRRTDPLIIALHGFWNTRSEILAIYYNGIDHFGHAFMDFHLPRREGVPEDLFEMNREVMNGAYRLHDILDRLLQLVPPETTVLLVSTLVGSNDLHRTVGRGRGRGSNNP